METMLARRLYARHAAAAARGHWSVERDVRWNDIDPGLAHATPALLASLRDAALIEAYHPVNLAALLADTWDDVDAGVVFSLELYEGFKHFHALRMYLERVSYEPPLTDDAIVRSRRAAVLGNIPGDGVSGADAGPVAHGGSFIARLVEFMLSEHLASYFFRRAAEQAREPVLRELLERIAADEVRHAQSASDLIAKRIAADRTVAETVLRAAVDFQHFGERVVDDVPVAMPGDPVAIQTFARRIERLCGVRLIDWMRDRLDAG